MGSQSGGGYASSPSGPQVLFVNIERLAKRGWPLDREGRFGTKVSEGVSEIVTDNPLGTAKQFFDTLGEGGKPRTAIGKYGPVEMRVFDDNSTVTHRKLTRSSVEKHEDNPAVEIHIRTENPRYPGGYRIHFRRERAGES